MREIGKGKGFRPIGKSFEEALANLVRAKEIAATGPPQNATAPELHSGARGAEAAVNGMIARAEIPNESPPLSQERKGVFEADRERWLREILADRDLLLSTKVILFALSLYLNRETRTCWPSYGRLAKDTGLSPATALRAVRLAERRGYLRISGNYDPQTRQRKANIYAPLFHLGETGSAIQTKWGYAK